ncbi:hypothetical protein ACFX13_026832 [Malus domestica]
MGKEKSRGKAFNWRCLYKSSREEELARQLQNQFDLDDYHVQKGPCDVDAENIKMSMFSYQKEDDRDYEGRGGRRQGRSRERGRVGFR